MVCLTFPKGSGCVVDASSLRLLKSSVACAQIQVELSNRQVMVAGLTSSAQYGLTRYHDLQLVLFLRLCLPLLPV